MVLHPSRVLESQVSIHVLALIETYSPKWPILPYVNFIRKAIVFLMCTEKLKLRNRFDLANLEGFLEEVTLSKTLRLGSRLGCQQGLWFSVLATHSLGPFKPDCCPACPQDT